MTVGAAPFQAYPGRYWETLVLTLASKEAERAELHKTIWRIANDLRGSSTVGTSRATCSGCCFTG